MTLPETVAAAVLDLDGVVVDSRASYRLAYTFGIDSWLREDLGLRVEPPPGRPTLLDVEDVHALKAFPGFNAPIDVVAFFGAYALAQARDGRVGPLDPTPRAFLSSRPHDPPAGRSAHAIDADLALRRCREHYAGDASCERVYGYSPSRQRGEGLWRRDRLLIPPDLPPPPLPLAVFTGRDAGEARWVTGRLRLFDGLPDDRLWTRDDGVDKPDPAAFSACVQALSPGPVLYVGDLPADADLIARYRALRRAPEVVLALVGDEAPRARADLWLPEAGPLLAALPYILREARR